MAEASGSAQPEEGAAAGVAPKKKHQDVETQNLEKVTDYVEEAENSEELGKVCKELCCCTQNFNLHLST